MIKKILMTSLLSIIAINSAHAMEDIKPGEGAPVIHTEEQLREAQKKTGADVGPARTIEGMAAISSEARENAASLRTTIQHKSIPIDLMHLAAHVVRSYKLAERSGLKTDYVSAQMADLKTVLENVGLIASRTPLNAIADKDAVTAILGIGDKMADGTMTIDEMNSFAKVIMAMGDKLRANPVNPTAKHQYDAVDALHEALTELYQTNWREKLDKLLNCIV